MSVEGIGASVFWRIRQNLERVDSDWGEFWFSHSNTLWRECGVYEHQKLAILQFQKQFSPEGYYGWLKEQHIGVAAYNDKNYPKLLKEIESKPIILFTKGKKKGWNQLPISVVGTRKISAYGRVATAKIVSELVMERASIVSGFMYGVDAEAHKATVQLGGYTVGVLGYGFDWVYPPEHKTLFEQIIAFGGSFVTEYAPFVSPNKGTFVARNRIVAGMSRGTVVIEAGIKSGSHITVEFALDYDRSVFAVPGPITNPYSEGTKWLIKQGAILASSGKDILDELNVSTQEKVYPKQTPNDPFQLQLFSQLQGMSQTADSLAATLKEPVARVQSALSEMELEGYVGKTGASWTVR